MARLANLALLLAITLAATGCGWSPVDGAGGVADGSAHLAPAAAWGSHIRGWQRQLRAAATDNPAATYPTPSRSVLLRRLHRTSIRYDFRVVSVRILHAPQGSPEVIVQAAEPETFARSVPAIMRVLDPRHPDAEDWLGWSYRGILSRRPGQPAPSVPRGVQHHARSQRRPVGSGRAALSVSARLRSHCRTVTTAVLPCRFHGRRSDRLGRFGGLDACGGSRLRLLQRDRVVRGHPRRYRGRPEAARTARRAFAHRVVSLQLRQGVRPLVARPWAPRREANPSLRHGV